MRTISVVVQTREREDYTTIRGMKFTILGATGPAGLALVKECLEKGHHVTALVRNPDKITVKHENLTVEKVNIMKEDELVPHVQGRDAVMSCLGAQSGIFGACTLYTDTIRPITAAMRKSDVTRFVGMASWGTKYDPGLPFLVKWIMRPLLLRNIVNNMAEMENFLADSCKDLDYTIVRPPGLSDEQSSGKEVATAEEMPHVPGVSNMYIPRRDVAKFMLMCVVEGQWKKTCVAVGLK